MTSQANHKCEQHWGEITALKSYCKANQIQIDRLEANQQELRKIASAVEVIANEQKHIGEKVDKLNNKVDVLESKPGKRWETIISAALIALIGALIGWTLSGLGIN